MPRLVDTGLVDLELRSVEPHVLVPGSVIVVEGDSFVDDPWGTSVLALSGTIDDAPVTLQLPATFVDFQRLEVPVSEEAFAGFGSDAGRFEGHAFIEVQSAVDGRLYRSSSLDLELDVARHLQPELALQNGGGIIFPNEPLGVQGDGLLLGESEGVTWAVVEGCFRPRDADTCDPIEPEGIPVVPATETDRTAGTFVFAPRIAGISPGTFEGTVKVVNEHADGEVLSSDAHPATYDMVEPILYGIDTTAASLGQYVTVTGAGFVGNGEGDTLLAFVGTFTPVSTGVAIPIDELLLPEFVDGRTVRYVLNEDDALGNHLDVRLDRGRFEGMITPLIGYMGEDVAGSQAPLSFELLPVKQVVWVDFLPAYKESLRHFGLRAVDQSIRERVVTVMQRDYTTLNVEVRTEQPEDFALYALVEIGGPDLNGLGLLGYDNTPGKDTENQRLYDRIGGVNALTQEDGFPGYGGVFIESLFGYSEHPGEFAEPLRTDERFDAVFDPFRPDRGGRPVLAEDLGGDLPTVDGDDCPADGSDRQRQIACAIWVLGNLVGTTVSHEVGHSLGLADPYGPFFHNSGDADDRLMDADRPFGERAELAGEGPSRFCIDEYDYLRAILPSSEPYDVTARASCF
jgi:hypothetical protein